ncbi:MAG TPA: chromosome segregation protein SMC [Chryseolinea sp.]|nr:chromosome segregation protein SMC [Chryseolinea sp.]HPM32564.1 chromosome segregation protein SMC [Chryseolinea sp.]
MSESTSTQPITPEPKKSNKTAIIISIMAIVIIVQGVKIYLDSQEKHGIKTELASTEEELATTMQRMEEIKLELDQKIAEVTKLGGNVEDLEKAKAEVEAALARRNKATGKEIKVLKDKVEGYETLLKNKDEEIEKLNSVNKVLLTENKTLKTQKNVLGDSINRLSQSKDELATKVAIASQLKVENVKIVALNDRGKERESPFKNRQVGKLRIDFNLAENKVAPVEGKKIMIRIIDENGQVIFDVARGSGTFIFEGKEEFYTASQEILFDNTKQKLSYTYEKGSDYPSGTYTIEVYTDDYKMGSGQFVVK